MITLGRRALLIVIATCVMAAGDAGDRAARATGGTLIAAFLTKTEIVLCSDGRAVNASTGVVVSDAWTKIHRLTDRVGLLTAGRDLPGLVPRFRAKQAAARPSTITQLADLLQGALDEEWAALPPGDPGGGAGRSFVFMTGFDAVGAPRIFHLDSQARFRVQEMPLFGGGRELEIAAMSTGSGLTQDPSGLLLRQLQSTRTREPAIDLLRWLLSSFDAAKAELASQDPRIGGRTFVAVIDVREGFRELR